MQTLKLINKNSQSSSSGNTPAVYTYEKVRERGMGILMGSSELIRPEESSHGILALLVKIPLHREAIFPQQAINLSLL
ncbi:hypothetical protein, partial [Acinetobacter baumannii]|uniref:hypothetical protein n=1 Tax=Acinetobacter baumannii TaxID=470 RepID=UPI001BB4669E